MSAHSDFGLSLKKTLHDQLPASRG